MLGLQTISERTRKNGNDEFHVEHCVVFTAKAPYRAEQSTTQLLEENGFFFTISVFPCKNSTSQICVLFLNVFIRATAKEGCVKCINYNTTLYIRVLTR